MPILGDPGSGLRGPFHDLLRLQTDFQEQLTTATLAYLRQLQGLIGPVVPGTALMTADGAELAARGRAGQQVKLQAEIENRQRVHCLVSPMLSPLVCERGITWYATPTPPPDMLLLPSDGIASLSFGLSIPQQLRPGDYRGGLIFYGVHGAPIPVRVTVLGVPEKPDDRGMPEKPGGASPVGEPKRRRRTRGPEPI